MYCTGGTECLSHTPGSQSVCAVRTPLGVDWKILSIRKEPILSGFLTLNAHSFCKALFDFPEVLFLENLKKIASRVMKLFLPLRLIAFHLIV